MPLPERFPTAVYVARSLGNTTLIPVGFTQVCDAVRGVFGGGGHRFSPPNPDVFLGGARKRDACVYVCRIGGGWKPARWAGMANPAVSTVEVAAADGVDVGA